MLCPACKDVNLSMADRQGIEIDYCPKCRGVWLDRGELDRIIERTDQGSAAAPRPAAAASPPPVPERLYEDHRPYKQGDHYHDGYRKKRKKSLLGEIFDF
ncbi:zf-TFIIB domain-containing protein [Stenotrophomonas sp. MMGLT7]|uniref:TFIIB-type zinc ribbon-containing protein n=1 Tax=Stenotrophomonas sp. MMGLT7 TaxID=2901227 RepID=UPI001E5FA6B5|nr:zf-TFIIB domain-containing protein [Stenotrophomonas sp. MMGLT7]MCD7097430.1 zf-TFIIB domain-containing protein [Stenotrophomonas sp. MMGLT7]